MIESQSGQIVTPLIDAANAKIQNPDYDCSLLRDPQWALRDTTYRYAPPEPATVDWSQYVPPVGDSGSANDFNGAQESSGDDGGAQVSRPPPVALDDSPSAVREAEVDSGDGRVDKAPGGDQEATKVDCPPEYTGYFSTADCAMYGYCQGGTPVGVALPCVPGTLFDVTTSACTWANMVSCGQSPSIEEGEQGSVQDSEVNILNGNAVTTFTEKEDASASIMNSNRASDVDLNISVYSDSNPSNFFCGASPQEAAELCIPCPSGLMIDCGDDFMRGCFRDIEACATSGGGS